MEWQPIETAPKNAEEILVYSFREGAFVAFWHGPRAAWLWTSHDLGGDETLNPTHWTAIPPLPDE